MPARGPGAYSGPVNVLELPHTQARELLATGAPVFLAVNPLEYHGPHLSLRNDALIAGGIARDLHQRLAEERPEWPFLTATALEVGCDVVPGPGATETPYPTVRRLVRDACAGLAALGARRVVVMTFHGGPHHNHALQAGVRLLEGRGVQALAPLNVVLRTMLSARGADFAPAFAHVEDPAEREALARELRYDFHAGFFETSLSLHYARETVSPAYTRLPPCPPLRPRRGFLLLSRLAAACGAATLARELRYAAHGTGWYDLRPFPGYTGRPQHASPSAGAYFAGQVLDRFTAAAREVFAGRGPGPRPIMAWLPRLSLGGRVGHPRLRMDQIALEPGPAAGPPPA